MSNPSNNHTTITRYPPSPTGVLHIGSARTALFNYLYAKKEKGDMILRFEDTDRERSKSEYEDEIKEALEWLGFTDFLGPFKQSERTLIYHRYLKELVEKDLCYVSKEKPTVPALRNSKGSEGEDAEEREIIRFRNPGTTVAFEDVIRGTIEMDTSDLGDFVIAKGFDEPLYHLAVVVDDHEGGVTHVIRGEDHISNTARQILIQEAIGAPRPVYAHIPLILGPDRSKLSKRHGATSVLEYRTKGFLPEALVNYMALLGWNPGTNEEVFSFNELVQEFSLDNVQKSGAIFNLEKLRWINKKHVEKLSRDDFFDYVESFLPDEVKALPHYSRAQLERLEEELRERLETFEDVTRMANEGELEYYFEKPDYFAEGLLWKKDPKPRNALKHLEFIEVIVKDMEDDNFDKESIKKQLWEYATEEGRGDVLWPMRYALSGVDRSPDPFSLAEILGKEETLARINTAQEKLKEEIR